MCGYLNDAPASPPSEEELQQQFAVGLQKFQEHAQKQSIPPESVVFKIFTSGSFFDPEEVPRSLQDDFLQTLIQDARVGEIAVESRPEYVMDLDPNWLARIAHGKHLDVGVGLEAVTDPFRDAYIQKGFSFADFERCHQRLQECGAGTKVYLTLKPTFVSESIAVAEVAKSIRVLLELGVDTISINPVAVQKNTLVESLFKKHLYRPPWLFSVLWALELGVSGRELNGTRILCSPIAGGKVRGVHNCNNPTCNQKCLDVLRQAVETQQFSGLLDQVQCACKTLWQDELAIF
jgi:hypothetical protein